MPLSNTVERDKFVEVSDGETGIRILAPPLNFGSVDNLVETQDSVYQVENDLGFNTIGFHCVPPVSGIITFETSYDDVNWEATSIRGITSDTVTSTISEEGNFIGSISTNRCIRFRTSTPGTAPGTIMGRLQRDSSVVEHIEFSAPPHKVGFPTVRHHDAFTEAQTNFVLWDPPAGKAIVLTDMFVFAHGSTDGVITIFMEDNTNGNVLFANEVSVSVIGPFNFNHQFKLGIVGGVDEQIKITTSTAIDCDIMLQGYEI